MVSLDYGQAEYVLETLEMEIRNISKRLPLEATEEDRKMLREERRYANSIRRSIQRQMP